MKTRISIVAVALTLSILAGVAIASAAQPAPPDGWPNTPAYTSRYPAVADHVALMNRISDLEYRVMELEWLRAHDVQQRDTFRAHDVQAWALARAEDQKRLTSLELSANDLYNICMERR